MHRLLAVLLALVALALPSESRAAKRVALVIGNAAYQYTTPLLNPSNDATDVADALRRLGFEVVDGRDLDKRAMERLIREFSVKLAAADVALFFYAGHGLQVEGKNYLLPTDAKLASEGDIDFESLPVDLVIKQMERDAKTSLVLLDACRDNPLARSLARNLGARSTQVGQGLAEVKVGVGTLIGYSTQPGAFALDGTGRNSPYTAALLKYVEAPARDVSGVLVEVRNDVLKATGGRQVPWEHTSLTGQVYLSGQAVPASTEAPQVAGLPPPPTASPVLNNYDKELELLFWNTVKDSKSPDVLQAYLDRYPKGSFTALARILLANIREPVKVAALPSPAPDSAQVAALPIPDVRPRSSGADPQVLARALQSELKRVGCDPGSADGRWGAKAKEALAEFVRRTQVVLPSEEPTAAALEALAARNGRVCPADCDKGEKQVNGKCVAEAKPAKKAHTAKARERDDDPPARRSRESSGRQSGESPVGGLSIGIGIGRRGGVGIGF